MKTILLASTFSLAVAGGAIAADAVVYEPVPEAAAQAGFVWTGGYIGLQAGYMVGGSVDHTLATDTNGSYNLSPDGMFGGLYVGYNQQFANRIVLGAEGDFAIGNAGASGNPVGSTLYRSTNDFDWTGSIRARLGYSTDRFLPYVTGGVAFGRLSYEEREGGAFYSDAEVDLMGWTIGGGAEYALSDNWILRGEYRYVRFNDKDFVPSSDENLVARIRTHDFRIGAAYKF
ncbi:Opacity protein antigen [Aminobacter sp. MSH1]|nr:Opacity protein antigen [Aminobacter sp. MSH1]